MTFGVVGNHRRERVGEVVERIVEALRERGEPYIVHAALKDECRTVDPLRFAEDERLYQAADVVLSVGGDGTWLNAAYAARKRDKPTLGVNFGRLGFLAEVEINRIDQVIDELTRGEYRIEERFALDTTIEGVDRRFYAINDLVIDKAGGSNMLEMVVSIDGRYVATILADGLIVATPTGSTAYALSAGGPIVTPGADVLTLCAIAPHSLTVRPLVAPASSTVEVRIPERRGRVGVYADGERSLELDAPFTLRVARSNQRVKLVRPNSVDYFATLRRKLFWGADARAFGEKKA
jgi:NAD+ kinase